MHALNVIVDGMDELERYQYDVCKSGVASDDAQDMIMITHQITRKSDIHKMQQLRIVIRQKASEIIMERLNAMGSMGAITGKYRTYKPPDEKYVDYLGILQGKYEES